MSRDFGVGWSSEPDPLSAGLELPEERLIFINSFTSLDHRPLTYVNLGVSALNPAETSSEHSQDEVPSTLRFSVFEEAEKLVNGLPMKRKASALCKHRVRIAFSSPDSEATESTHMTYDDVKSRRLAPPGSTSSHRKPSAIDFEIAEDLADNCEEISLWRGPVEKIPTADEKHVFEQASSPRSFADANYTSTYLSETTLRKLNAFRHVANSAGAFMTKHSKLDQHAAMSHHSERDWASKRGDLAVIRRNHQMLASTSLRPSPDPAIGHKINATAPTPSSGDDEDDALFDQYLAEDEADQFPPFTTPVPFETPMTQDIRHDPSSPPVPPLSLLALDPATLPAASSLNIPSKAFTPYAPPIKVIFRASTPSPTSSILPIPNLSPHLRIPTCFRLAEVLRLSSTGTTSPFRAIELYACVIESSRQDDIQTYKFADLFFPQRPPYLHGIYTDFNESELFETDAAAFLPQNIIPARDATYELRKCRAIIRPAPARSTISNVRDCTSSPLANPSNQPSSSQISATTTQILTSHATRPDFEILSIWKCSWDDIQYVKGIVIPEADNPFNHKQLPNGETPRHRSQKIS